MNSKENAFMKIFNYYEYRTMEFAVTFSKPFDIIDEDEYKNKRSWIMDFSNQTRRPMNSYEIDNMSVLPENTNIDINQHDKVTLFKSFALFAPEEPADEHTEEPVEEPADEPTEEPVEEPTEEHTEEPVEEPTEEPTEEPADEPTEEPAEEPTEEPVEEPADEPTETADEPDVIAATTAIQLVYTDLKNKKKKIQSAKEILMETLEDSGIELDAAFAVFDKKIQNIDDEMSALKEKVLKIFD